MAELDSIERFYLGRDHHEIVDRLIVHQQLAIPIIHLTTGWVLGDKTEDITIRSLLIGLVQHL